MNTAYKFRAESPRDCHLAKSIFSPWLVSWTETKDPMTNGEWYGDMLVTFEVRPETNPPEFLVWLLGLGTDLHVIMETLREAESFTGVRTYDSDNIPPMSSLYLSKRFDFPWYKQNVKVEDDVKKDFEVVLAKLQELCPNITPVMINKRSEE